jgi:TRAP-type mannitol/chloroaromatic compound transport system permease small subunit
MKRILSIIDAISDYSGKFMSYWVLAMIAVLVYEVISRYVFNAPTVWAHQTASLLFAAYGILLGAYALLKKAHVRVDIVYNVFSPRGRAIADSITYLVFFLFGFVLFWFGTVQAIRAVGMMEGPTPPFILPVWPIRITVPLGALLILLQGLADWIRRLNVVFTGKEIQ